MRYAVKTIHSLENGGTEEVVWAEVSILPLAEVLKEHLTRKIEEDMERNWYIEKAPQVVIVDMKKDSP